MIYAVSIVLALVVEPAWRAAIWFALAEYVIVAALWLVPDRRMERYIAEQAPGSTE